MDMHAQSLRLCPALCGPKERSPAGSSVHGISAPRILEWVAVSSSRGIFPTQGSNPCLLCLGHCQADSLPLSPLGSPGYEDRKTLLTWDLWSSQST